MDGGSQGGDRGNGPGSGSPRQGRPPAEPRRPFPWSNLFLLLALTWLFWTWIGGGGGAGKEIPYSEFKQRLAAGEVVKCRVDTDRIEGTIRPQASAQDAAAQPEPAAPVAAAKPGAAGQPAEKPAAKPAEQPAGKRAAAEWVFHTLRVDDPGLVADLQRAGVEYEGSPASNLSRLWTWILLGFLLMPLFLLPLLRRGMGQASSRSPFGFGRSRARLITPERTGVTFADVAGCDEAKTDLREVVAFLKNPARFAKLGARVPKGVLLLGPPGTGKTLLARAVAGEAGVPFFSISGSEFVEMFVGVGAARVRDLFEQAKKSAPCIVFIDEIDAIGRSRGVHIGVVNDEREQTLNQLLVELDGFEPNSGVMMLAATNRPDVLDRALLRPGRFDRQVVLDAPDAGGREAILRVHARGKPLAPDVDLAAIARGTPGFSGADLANALNEAALLASRRDAEQITQRDLEEAVEKVVAGPERTSRRMRESERRRVAYHEAGHALVAHYSEHADPVHKISIVPRGRAALGYTMQRPVAEQLLLTQSELTDRITGLLGGRCAEELAFDEVSTGAADDLERATDIARQMVAIFGMGEAAGLMRCIRETEGMFLRGPEDRLQRDCSEETASRIDAEVKALLEQARQRARQILAAHRVELDAVAQTLLQRERLEKAEFERLLGPRPFAAPAPAGRDGQSK